jgi:hypothetical protein
MANTKRRPVFTLEELLLAQRQHVEKDDAATGRFISLRNTGGVMFGSESAMELTGSDITSSFIVTCMGEDTNIIARALLDAVFDENLRLASA